MTIVFGLLSIVLAALLVLDVVLLSLGGPDPDVRQPVFGLSALLVPLGIAWFILSAWTVHGYVPVATTPLSWTGWHIASASIGALCTGTVMAILWGMRTFARFIGCDED